MKKILIILIITATNLLNAQVSKPLAKFSGQIITPEEFKFRFELSPRAGGSAELITQKEQFLHTLISEKLWALEAKSIGLDNDHFLGNYLSIIKKMYVRDALFKNEVENKIIISKDEIEKDLNKINSELEIKFLFSENRNEIDSLYEKLQSGVNFDVLLNDRNEKNEQLESIKVVYGQVDEKKENILFSLKKGTYSKPTQEKIGWVIYFLKSKNQSPLSVNMNFEEKNKSVKEVIENRKKKVLFENVVKQIYGDQSINVDIELFNKLKLILIDVIDKKCERINCSKSEKIILYEADFNFVKTFFTDQELKSIFIKFDVDPISLDYFLDDLSFKEFQVESISANKIEKTLSGYTREFITLEILAREGNKKDYANSKQIQNELELWRNNYLSQMLKNRYVDSANVTEDEAFKYYLESQNDSAAFPKIKIIELVTEDLQVIEEVLNKISSGVDFRELALKYSNRNNISGNIEIELNYSNNYPELKEAAQKIGIGEFGGPIKTKYGYSIFKVIEKEDVSNVYADSFAVMKENIKQKLLYKNMSQILNDKTVELAKKYNLEVNEDMLQRINTTKINALIYRHFGFGGRILAAPFLNLFYEWYDQYQKEINEPL